MMLFLKNVQHISLYEWQGDAPAPVCFFETRVANVTRQLVQQRNYVLTAVAAAAAAAASRDADGNNKQRLVLSPRQFPLQTYGRCFFGPAVVETHKPVPLLAATFFLA